MSKKVTKTDVKIKKRPTMIPYKKSELFFVHPRSSTSHSSSSNKRSNKISEIIIIDGPAKIIKKILANFDCEVKCNSNKQNFVKCDSQILKSLKEVLYSFQEQHIIKFVVFCPCKCRTKIKHPARDVVAHITIEGSDNLITFDVDIPKEDIEVVIDNKYSQYNGKNVKIVANSVDGVARTAKLMGVLLNHFDDNCLEGDFTGYGIVHQK
jgi:hypothetical protein